MALKKVKGNIERMFDKNLTDLVRGIRNNKENEAKYISQCMEDIKQELRQDNLSVKSNAIAKLTYLQMLGYDISWAGFNIIEVMSSNKFTLKRIGYLAASQSFHCDSELLMLTTNMIRKELNSQNQYEAGLALTSLSCYISMDLARDLSNDILTLLSSTKPYIRKKAVLMMYKVFLKYPEALRPAFPRLKEKLEDPDPEIGTKGLHFSHNPALVQIQAKHNVKKEKFFQPDNNIPNPIYNSKPDNVKVESLEHSAPSGNFQTQKSVNIISQVIIPPSTFCQNEKLGSGLCFICTFNLSSIVGGIKCGNCNRTYHIHCILKQDQQDECKLFLCRTCKTKQNLN